MTNKQIEYVEYLKQYTRESKKSIQEANKEKLIREVGKSYGLTDAEMDEAVRSV